VVGCCKIDLWFGRRSGCGIFRNEFAARINKDRRLARRLNEFLYTFPFAVVKVLPNRRSIGILDFDLLIVAVKYKGP